MDVLLQAMECNNTIGDTYFDSSTLPSTRSTDHDQIFVVADESDCSNASNPLPKDFQHASFTRKSCHRCGNIRKNCRKCSNCPHIICKNCVLKMAVMFKKEAFNAHSCPVCALRCCCNNKSSQCINKYHCYRKCPVSRLSRRKQPAKIFPRYCFTADMLTETSLMGLQGGSTTASIAVDSDTDSGSAVGGMPLYEGQDEPETEEEESSGSQSPWLPSISSSMEFFEGRKSSFTITSRGNAVHDLKLPGFLSSGLLLGGEVHAARSSIYPTTSIGSRGALISCDDKMPGSPFFYSV